MKWETVSKPCRNFCFFNEQKVYDPRDGGEKICFSSFSDADNGVFVLLDTDTLAEERYGLPYDSGAWAVIQLPEDHSLLFGTCPHDGAAHRFDMKSRTWAGSVKADEKYIWHFAAGSDGHIYGGTWPGCVLLRYNPKDGTLVNLGKTTDNPDNNYSRHVYGQIPGKIYIDNGCASTEIAAYDIATGVFDYHFLDGASVVDIFDPYIIVRDKNDMYQAVKPDKTRVYDSFVSLDVFLGSKTEAAAAYGKKLSEGKDDRDLSIGGALITMRNGDKFKSMGQEYMRIKKDAASHEIIRFTSEPPATNIHALISDESGLLWGATGLGMTIFKYDPKTGEYWNSLPVSNGGGEVYGMVSHDKKIYMTAYARGEHTVYDPSKPWDHRNNINPKTVLTVSPDYIRPITYSKIDPAGFIWTGWTARYGTREMAISRWDAKTDEIKVFEKLVPGQAVSSLDTDGENVWFATGAYANGLPNVEDNYCICAMDRDGQILFKHTFEKSIYPGAIRFIGKKGVIGAGGDLFVIDAETFGLRKADGVTLKSGHISNVTRYDATSVAIFDAEAVLFFDLASETVKMTAPAVRHNTAAVSANGEFYANSSGELMKLII